MRGDASRTCDGHHGLAAGLALPTAALASSRPIEYLAVGDSPAFGFNPLVSPADADNYVGYPDFVAESLGDTLTNAAGPGETSSHFTDGAGPSPVSRIGLSGSARMGSLGSSSSTSGVTTSSSA